MRVTLVTSSSWANDCYKGVDGNCAAVAERRLQCFFDVQCFAHCAVTGSSDQASSM
jgi:hypothetical protein